MGWESQEDGIVAAVLVKEGDQEVAVGQVVLVMVDDASQIGAFSDYTATAAASPPPAAAAAAAAPAAPAAAAAPAKAAAGGAAPAGGGAPAKSAGARVLASPLARALAREAGVPLSAAKASGPHGRVLASDVMAAIEPGATGAGMSLLCRPRACQGWRGFAGCLCCCCWCRCVCVCYLRRVRLTLERLLRWPGETRV